MATRTYGSSDRTRRNVHDHSPMFAALHSFSDLAPRSVLSEIPQNTLGFASKASDTAGDQGSSKKRTLDHFFGGRVACREKSARAMKGIKAIINEQEPSSSLHQTFLDLGQKDAVKRTCKGCGMAYSHGLADDEEVHTRYHKSVMKGLQWPWSVKDHPDGQMLTSQKFDKIVLTSAMDKRLSQVLQAVDSGLGASAMSASRKKLSKALLYLRRKKEISAAEVLAVVIVEPIKSAFRVIPCPDSSGSGLIVDQKAAVQCCVGVARIWTNPAWRRKGFARALLEHSLSQFSYGVVMTREQVAFSQPSESGKALAEHWTGRSDFLVYREEDVCH